MWCVGDEFHCFAKFVRSVVAALSVFELVCQHVSEWNGKRIYFDGFAHFSNCVVVPTESAQYNCINVMGGRIIWIQGDSTFQFLFGAWKVPLAHRFDDSVRGVPFR